MEHSADVAVIGAGLSGIVASLELLDAGKRVILLDAASRENIGGLANNAFGGMALNSTPEQKRLGVRDSPELMYDDWIRAAEFKAEHQLQRNWAHAYVYRSREEVYNWLGARKVGFFPVVNWVERGDFRPGNSVPRYHVAWGCGRSIVDSLLGRLLSHSNNRLLTLLTDHYVDTFDARGGAVHGCSGRHGDERFRILSDAVIVASGGINGNLGRVRDHWDPCYGPFPRNMLNGCSPLSDGSLHDRVGDLGGRVENLGWMWNYAAGIEKPDPAFPGEGLALIPPRSALWMDCYGRRVGPDPMIGAFDTHRLCKRMGHLPKQYGWLVLNWKIAIREMAVSGSDMNPAFRDKRILKVLLGTLLGARGLMEWMTNACPDVVTGASLDELANNMERLAPETAIDRPTMEADISRYDRLIKAGTLYYADDQLRRIRQCRRWIGDYLRTANFRPINDSKALPLIAIRLRMLSRKSMGGIVTDLQSRVLDQLGEPIPGLYAAGESAGFGGGGISGVRSLEGTFLSNCIFGARIAAAAINGGGAGTVPPPR